MTDIGIVDLAHAPDFKLGGVQVRPARRQVVSPSGNSEVVQPRVMQVLVALARAQGAIVTRDELTQACWEGRVVGEDAINRVIFHVRRLSQGVGAGAFSIETITKVGYRLHDGAPAGSDAEAVAELVRPWADQPAAPDAGFAVPRPRLDRRLLLGLGAGAVAAGAVGGALVWRRWAADQPPSPQAAAQLERAMQSLMQGTPDGRAQAIGFLQNVVAVHPNYADGWGALGVAYAESSHWRSEEMAGPLRDRARQAVTQARTLDPDNLYAEVAAATTPPSRGAWLTAERALRAAFTQHPNTFELPYLLAEVLCSVGRHSDAAVIFETVRQHTAPSPPCIYFCEVMSLWGANRLEETDRLLDEAAGLYPTQYALWFARVYTLMFSGRSETALGLLQDTATRPNGIPTGEFDRVADVARAFVSRDPKAIDEVMQVELARAKLGAGYAENTMQFASAFGRLDEAFAVANAYYFSDGFAVPEVRFTVEQGSYTPMGERQAAYLFYPSTAPMRADPRFQTLAQRLGLVDYWRASGSQPDR